MAGTTRYGNRRSHGNERASRRAPQISAAAKQLWPEIRICRMADIEVPAEAFGWHEYLDRIGRLNYGIGNARSLGSIAVTFIKATEMGKMLNKKYPRDYESPARTKRLHKRFGTAYNKFVEDGGRVIVDSKFGPIELEPEHKTEEVKAKKIWKPGNFATSDTHSLEQGRLAFDLSEETELIEGFRETLEYLQGEGLDTNFVDPHRMLHATVFQAFGRLDQHEIKHPQEHPGSLRLMAPEARWTE